MEKKILMLYNIFCQQISENLTLSIVSFKTSYVYKVQGLDGLKITFALIGF